MKRFFFIGFSAIALYSCCKMICEDQGIHIRAQNFLAADTDTMYLIKYKPHTSFADRIDTIKRYAATPVSSTQASSFFEVLDANVDWKIVIPALNKEYFISDIETTQERCECEGGKYTLIKKLRVNNVEKKGSVVLLN